MKFRFSIRTLLVAITVWACGLVLWGALANKSHSEVVDRFRWHDYSTGVARQARSSGWRHCGTVTFGKGVCVVLEHCVVDSDKYDGSGGYYLSFQLPANAAAGDRFTFTPVPTTRQGELHPQQLGFTLMLPGEFTAHHFGQHVGQVTWTPEDQKPTLTIKSIDDAHVVLHLALDVPIPGFYDLKIDRDYTVRRVDPYG